MSDISKTSMLFAPKRNERLDNVIEMLKDHIGFVPGEDAEARNLKTSTTELTTSGKNASRTIPIGDSSLAHSYIMWQNNANVCWLDASMALLVHNRTLTQSINESNTTQIANIIRNYYKAISILNDYSDSKHIDERVRYAKDLLKSVQESALKYLHPIVKYTKGEPDSAFCSLLNLIVEHKSVKHLFDLEYTWVQVCQECNTRRAKTLKKPIITLPRVEGFQPSSPISLYQCLVCKASGQRMTLNFRTLPQCLLFHFESGAGKGELQCTSFKVDERIYKMTGVMTHEKGRESNSNHFVTFIRDPPSDMWMECNDLCEDIMCFSVAVPSIDLQDVYILMFEAMDGNDTVPNLSLTTGNYGLLEESANGSVEIPLIDLEDEAEEDKTEADRKDAVESEESKNVVGNVNLSGKEQEEGSNKEAGENAGLMGNDHGNLSCENTILLGKDPVSVPSKGLFEDEDFFGTDCRDDSAKDQCENEQLFKPVYKEEFHKDKFKIVGLFEKFHLPSKDKSNQNFSEGSMVDAVDDATMTDTTELESKDTFRDVKTLSNALVDNSNVNVQSQLHINNMENNSLQSGPRKSSTAYASLDKDILSTKNMKSLKVSTHSPKDNWPDAHSPFIDTCAPVSLSCSKSSRGAKKKLIKKDKLVLNQATVLGSEKSTNKISANFLVPENYESYTSGMHLRNIDNTSLEVIHRKALQTSTENKIEILVADQSKAKSVFKKRTCKLKNSTKVENHCTKTDDNLQDHPIKTPCIVSETSESSVQNCHVIKKKKIREQHMEKDLITKSNRPNKKSNAKQRKAKISLKNSKHKAVDNSIVDNSTKNGNDFHKQSIVISHVERVIENVSKLKNVDAIEEQLKIQSNFNNLNTSMQLNDINGSISPSFSEKNNFKSTNENEQSPKKELISFNGPFNMLSVAKENKTKSLLKNRNRRLLNCLRDEKTFKTDIVLQENASDGTSTETTSKSVNPSQTPGVNRKKNIRKVSRLKINNPSTDLNPSNDPPKRIKTKFLSKNLKRKCMDSLKDESFTKMDTVLQENVLSNMHADKSTDDPPSKKTRYQLRNVKPAVHEQNGTNLEMAVNEISDCNDQSDNTNSQVNELLPLNSGSKLKSLHGPSCLCDGTKMAEDLIDMVIGNVLKGVFSFIGIKEKE